MEMNRLEIKPKAIKNALLLAIGSLFFIGCGVVLVVSGEAPVGGVICILLFAILGPLGVRNFLRRKLALVLTGEGIEMHYPQGTAHVLWKDVESLGLSDDSVGIRLRSYDDYLASISPDLAKWQAKMLTKLKFIAGAALVLRFASDQGEPLWSRLPVGGEVDAIKSFGAIGSFAELLLFSRQMYGYEVMLSKLELDRSPEDFLNLLREYRDAAQEA